MRGKVLSSFTLHSLFFICLSEAAAIRVRTGREGEKGREGETGGGKTKESRKKKYFTNTLMI